MHCSSLGLRQSHCMAKATKALGKKGDKGTGKGVIPTITKTPTDPKLAAALQDLATKRGNKTLCLRYNRQQCTNKQCKYAHSCAIKLPNGQVCGQKHPAATHRFKNSTASEAPAGARHLMVCRGHAGGLSLGASSHPRLFLDFFAGLQCPLSTAMRKIGGDYLAPFDFALHSTHDILDDRVMHLLQKLCFSGVVGVAWSAPPCKEFSRLKLKQPRPKALRTPQPSMSSRQSKRGWMLARKPTAGHGLCLEPSLALQGKPAWNSRHQR